MSNVVIPQQDPKPAIKIAHKGRDVAIEVQGVGIFYNKALCSFYFFCLKPSLLVYSFSSTVFRGAAYCTYLSKRLL